MRLRFPLSAGSMAASFLAAVLAAGAAHPAAAQQAPPAASAPATASSQTAVTNAALSASCFSATAASAIIAGCDALLANRRAITADQIGAGLQRRGAARATLGQIAEALADFRQMIQANYKPHEAHASIAALQVREGKLADAEKSYREALRLNPSYGLAHNGLGNTLIALGRPAESLAHFNQAIATSETDVNAHFGKGLALFASGDLDGSIRSLGDALRLNPRMLAALSQRAQAHADKGNLRSALADADAAAGIAQGEERVRALTLRGRLRNAAKTFDGAAADCAEAVDLAERLNIRDAQTRSAAHVCLALAHQNRGKLGEAQQSYDAALQWVRDDASTYAGRGYVNLQRGRFDDAIADFNAALKVDPRSQDAMRFLGLTYADKGETAKAVEIFGKAIEADAKDPWPLMLRAVTVAKDGDRERALRDVQEAFRLVGPNSSDAHLVRGAVYYFVQDFAAARDDFDSAIRLNADNAQAHRLLGRLLIGMGRFDDAARSLDAASRLLPGDATVLLNRGLLAHGQRDFPAAIREITQSLAINAAHAEGFAVRGQAYEALGQTELAIADYRVAGTKLATDADGRRAQTLARQRLAALTLAAGVDSASNRLPRTTEASTPRPREAPAEPPERGANRTSTYCRVVEGVFSHSRKYTGVNFDLGCGPGL